METTEDRGVEDITQRQGFTPKKELFALLYLGYKGNAVKAASDAFDCVGMSVKDLSNFACKMRRDPYCAQRISEEMTGIADQTIKDAIQIVNKALDTYEAAFASGRYSAAVAALALVARLTGHDVQRLDLTSGGQPFEVRRVIVDPVAPE